MTTIRDVARECGVSAMTVSAVLNNRTGKVGAETRERVLRVIEEMGYQPNAIARGLTRRRMNTLGVVLAYEGSVQLMSERYISPLLNGVFAANKRLRQRSLIIAEDTWQDVEANLPNYLDGHCDGLLFVAPMLPASAFQVLVNRQVPFVIIGESHPEPFLATVDVDNTRAAADAVRYLHEHGHRRIGLLKGDDSLLSSGLRETGYRQALADAGLPCDECIVLPGSYSIASGYERAFDLLHRRDVPFPTALFCADDAIAVGAWRALSEQGVRVPEDVSLIGINDDQTLLTPATPLTTIRQPLGRLGERAVEIVLGQVSREAEPGEKFLAAGELIVRGSVARPASPSP